MDRRSFLFGTGAVILTNTAITPAVKLAIPKGDYILMRNGWPVLNGQIIPRAGFEDLFDLIYRSFTRMQCPEDGGCIRLPHFPCDDERMCYAICPRSDNYGPLVAGVGAVVLFVRDVRQR